MTLLIKIVLGSAVAILFLLLAVASASIGQLLGLDFFLWPFYWPLLFYLLPGISAFPLMAVLPDSINVFYLLFPEGGGPAVFGSMLLIALVFWTCLFAGVDAFGKIIPLPRNRNRTGGAPVEL